MSIIYCIGCAENKPESEMQKYKSELLCAYCRHQEILMNEYCKLEEQEMKITDEIMELQSEVEYARENLSRKESLVEKARKRYRENELMMINFKWQ